jgi:hypothetical protein
MSETGLIEPTPSRYEAGAQGWQSGAVAGQTCPSEAHVRSVRSNVYTVRQFVTCAVVTDD